MLDHVSIGVRDIAAARRFYDAAFAPLGYGCLYESEDAIAYGAEAPVFWVNVVQRPVPADPASGLHFSFTAASREAVDAFHAGAVGAGGTDNGEPGLRVEYDANYYAAFVLDPDGYRLEAHCNAALN